MSIRKTAKMVITCNEGFIVQMKHLKRIIEKFENAENFFLQITLEDTSAEELDEHAVQLMNVCIPNQTFFNILESCSIFTFFDCF